MFSKPLRVWAALILCSTLLLAQSDQSAKISAARKSAEKWLTLVDNGDYDRGWNEAAQSFKAAATLQQWQQAMTAIRQPLGKVLSRQLTNVRYTQEVPGAPDGDYVVIRHQTSFEQKKSAVETITPKLENGQWKVSGYFIK